MKEKLPQLIKKLDTQLKGISIYDDADAIFQRASGGKRGLSYGNGIYYIDKFSYRFVSKQDPDTLTIFSKTKDGDIKSIPQLLAVYPYRSGSVVLLKTPSRQNQISFAGAVLKGFINSANSDKIVQDLKTLAQKGVLATNIIEADGHELSFDTKENQFTFFPIDGALLLEEDISQDDLNKFEIDLRHALRT